MKRVYTIGLYLAGCSSPFSTRTVIADNMRDGARRAESKERKACGRKDIHAHSCEIVTVID